jgi:hypothetical protein
VVPVGGEIKTFFVARVTVFIKKKKKNINWNSLSITQKRYHHTFLK